MISVSKALSLLRSHPFPIMGKHVKLEHANGHVLLQEIRADRDFPPYDRVTMDGFAISHQAFTDGQRTFPIKATVAAGSPKLTISDSQACVEIMTGAVLPHGLDTVIKYEDASVNEGQVTLDSAQIPRGLNVHHQGTDRQKGTIIVPKYRRLSPAEIAIAATTGYSNLEVARLPSVVVVSTGDELVSVDQTPQPHQIRTSNNYTLAAALKEMGLEVAYRHLPDNKEAVRQGISEFLAEFEVIILIGGSSKGKYDFIPPTLRDLGITEHFYKVRQRPGKPFMFGTRGHDNFVFALPGNPVSAFMCLTYYFQDWLNASLQLPRKLPMATLANDIIFKPDLTYFAQVKIHSEDDHIVATPLEGKGSGDLANLTDADAFMILPEGRDLYPKGFTYPFATYRR